MRASALTLEELLRYAELGEVEGFHPQHARRILKQFYPHSEEDERGSDDTLPTYPSIPTWRLD
jgi:hypothetical protein